MEFNYYYGEEAEQFSFIRIPKVMLIEERFSPLSLSAKILYGLLLDRMSLSARNGWLDEEKRVYIIFKIEEIQDILGFSKKKSIDYLNELEQFGLVEKKRRGLGLPSILYIKSFMLPEEENGTSRGVEIDTSVKANIAIDSEEDIENTVKLGSRNLEIMVSEDKSCVRGVDLGTSGGVEIALQEVSEREPLEVSFSAPLNNNTKSINTEINNIKSNPILSSGDRMGLDETNAYRDLLMTNIEYEYLLEQYPYDKELVEGILDIILEAVVSQKDYTVVSSDMYPSQIVKSKFLKLNISHIEYVMDCFKANTTKVRNIKKYLMAALFNAPSTISGYYQAEVNHDFPQYARAK